VTGTALPAVGLLTTAARGHISKQRVATIINRHPGGCKTSSESMAESAGKKESVSKNDPIMPLMGDDFENVYEPSEDTYLFMDALEKEMPDLKATRPAVIMEIGCGSGMISAYLAKNLHGPAYIATDINPHAIAAARREYRADPTMHAH